MAHKVLNLVLLELQIRVKQTKSNPQGIETNFTVSEILKKKKDYLLMKVSE